LKHCPVCTSDDIYKSSSMPMRLVVALVLAVLIPYGIVVAWVPFVFAQAFICRRCGNETKAQDLKASDWRERKRWIEEDEKKFRVLRSFQNHWIDDGEGPLKKVIYFKENWIAYAYDEQESKGNIIEGYDEKEKKLQLGGEVNFPNVFSREGMKAFLTEKELKNLTMNAEEELKNFMEQEGRLHRIATEKI